MTAIKRWHDSIFTGDVCIAKRDLPILVVVCIFSLIGAMYFGMFFARQEALHQAQGRQDQLVLNFAQITTNKDKQINALTAALTDSQNAYQTKLTSIEDMTAEIAIYLSTSSHSMDAEGVARLKERIRQIQAAVQVHSPGTTQ